MSNTVEINTGIPVAVLAGVAIAPVAIAGALAFGVIRALATDDPQCAELLRKSREALRRERWATIELRSADLGRLVRSARERGSSPRRLRPTACGSPARTGRRCGRRGRRPGCGSSGASRSSASS